MSIRLAAVAGLLGFAVAITLTSCSSNVPSELERSDAAPLSEVMAEEFGDSPIAAYETTPSTVGNAPNSIARGELQGDEAPQSEAMADAVVASPLMAYDESIPLTSTEAYWYMKDSLEELSSTSALAFVGRVTDYVERIKVVADSEEVPAEDRGFDVFDGVVFTVDELLLGSLPPGGTTVTVAVRTLILNPDGSPRFRVSMSPIETVEPGIAARDSLEQPSYLVYVTEDLETYSPFYNSGYYHFNTPGGVAPMLASDRIGVAADRPLARPVVVEDGVYTEIEHGLTLTDARGAARATEGEDDSSGPNPVDDLAPEGPGPGPTGSTDG